MIIQHNMSSMIANRNLGIARGKLSKATRMLSSGYKINIAADNAAGLGMSEKMRNQVRGLNQASDNMVDAVSAIQIADGAMAEIQSILQRINELCVKGGNDTNQAVDRALFRMK